MKHALVDGDDPLTIEKFCSTYPAFELRRVLEPPSKDAVRVELESSAGTAPGPLAKGAGRKAAMPTIMGHHDVKDREYWLASPKREEFFGPLGVTNIRTFVDPQNPNHVALMMDIPDMETFNSAMRAQEGAEAMAHDGVLPETLVILVES
jgi:hypothetical protein